MKEGLANQPHAKKGTAAHVKRRTLESGETPESQLQQEIARRKVAEHALQTSEADRKQLQELSALKDEYLSIASHQLRTPATIVKQYLGILLDAPESLTPGQREKVRLAFESNERQLKIINDLLMLASVEAGTLRLNRQPYDLGQLVHDVADEQSAEIARRNQTLEIVLPPLPPVPIDVRYVRMVVENLISNASKYSPQETPIVVSASTSPDGVFITVTDKGIGISKKDQEQLFKKFSRIDGDFTHSIEGTGLGLYWVKKIVELHNGTLKLESQVGRGSNFTVSFPL
jgi:signal transduction histidine kinase